MGAAQQGSFPSSSLRCRSAGPYAQVPYGSGLVPRPAMVCGRVVKIPSFSARTAVSERQGQDRNMKRAALATLAAIMVWPCGASAHDVPDDVRIKIFLKPEGDRMLILVRIPANALIDILFPTLPGSDWLDLKQIDGFATEGAKVWVADLLSLHEGDDPLPTPQVLAARISRTSDSSFSTFQKALGHANADRLPSGTLLVQDQAVVDALLETPIHSVRSSFSFEPRFARVGVRVTTTLAFLPVDGGVRQFEYEGDPEAFPLN